MKRSALLLPLVVLASLLLPVGSASAETYPEALLRYTNYERSKAHLPPLRVSLCVKGRFADTWSRHLAARRALSHQSLTPIMSQCHGNAAGENVAKGNVTPQRMVAMWMASPGHRANILSTRYNAIGVGATRGSDGAVYGVQDFIHV